MRHLSWSRDPSDAIEFGACAHWEYGLSARSCSAPGSRLNNFAALVGQVDGLAVFAIADGTSGHAGNPGAARRALERVAGSQGAASPEAAAAHSARALTSRNPGAPTLDGLTGLTAVFLGPTSFASAHVGADGYAVYSATDPNATISDRRPAGTRRTVGRGMLCEAQGAGPWPYAITSVTTLSPHDTLVLADQRLVDRLTREITAGLDHSCSLPVAARRLSRHLDGALRDRRDEFDNGFILLRQRA